VAAWTDRSGLGRHATQSASNQRPLRQGAAVRFDGADDALRADSLAVVLSGADHPFSAFLVFRQASMGTEMRPFTLASDTNAAPLHTLLLSASGGVASVVRRDGASLSKSLACGASNTSLRVFGHVFSGTSSSASLDATASTGDLSVGAAALTTCGLGARRTSSGYDRFLAGDLMEVAVFDRALTPWERTMLERGLRAKWGVA
jgi:hypothetical protein